MPRFTKYFVLLWLLLSLVVAGVLWVLYQVQVKHLHSLSQTEQRQSVQLAIQTVRTELTDIGADLIFLSGQSLLHQWLEGPTPGLRESLASDYLAFLKSNGRYDQIRFIDSAGKERIRVNWNDGRPTVVSGESLQDKSNRYYVEKGLALHRGEIYISPFDLNIEHGMIQQPMKPMIRFVTPIFDAHGSKRGILVLNYLGRRLIERIREIASQTTGSLWLLNEQGYWLFGSRPEQEWGFMFEARSDVRFDADYPDIWRAIMDDNKRGAFSTDKGLFTYAMLSPSGLLHGMDDVDLEISERWVIVSHMPAGGGSGRVHGQVSSLIIAFVLLSLCSAFIAWTIMHFMRKRHQAESALRSSEAAWRELVQSAPDAIVVVDTDGRIDIVNSQAEALFGYSREEMVGQPIELLIPQRYCSGHVTLRNNYIEQPRVRPMGEGRVLYGLRKDGSEFPVSISLSPIHSGGRLRIFSDIRDVTAQREAEQHIRDLNARLIQQNDELERVNHELEAFSYSVSHDLRTPLRAIDGFSRILLQEYAESLDDKGRDYLERVRKAAQKMGALIDDLLKLSRIARSEVQYETVDLSAMAVELLQDLQQGDSNRQVSVRVQENLEVRGDSRLLRVALDNLLGNAWKFTRGRADASIEFGMQVQDEEEVYYIRDNGAGFDMAYADKLFGAFQRLHDAAAFPGTGIGLATAQRVIHKHGGRVWAAGEPDQGATFYFTLSREAMNE